MFYELCSHWNIYKILYKSHLKWVNYSQYFKGRVCRVFCLFVFCKYFTNIAYLSLHMSWTFSNDMLLLIKMMIYSLLQADFDVTVVSLLLFVWFGSQGDSHWSNTIHQIILHQPQSKRGYFGPPVVKAQWILEILTFPFEVLQERLHWD